MGRLPRQLKREGLDLRLSRRLDRHAKDAALRGFLAWLDLPPGGEGSGQEQPVAYSHSIVPGGLLVISSTTRFTPFTSLTMRLEICSKTS